MSFFDSLVHATADGSWLGARSCDASLSRLLREMDHAHVERACLVGIAGITDNASVLRFASEHSDRLVPVAGFDPSQVSDDAELRGAVRRFADDGFRGVKLHPRLNSYDPLDSRCRVTMRLAGEYGLVAFLDTLFRQRARPVQHPIDVIDALVHECRETTIVLLHSAGASMLELFELGRLHEHILLDLSFSIMRYAGSSLDRDIPFLVEHLDQRVILGSDFPEFRPADTYERFLVLTRDVPAEKQRNVLSRNLERVFGLQ